MIIFRKQADPPTPFSTHIENQSNHNGICYDGTTYTVSYSQKSQNTTTILEILVILLSKIAESCISGYVLSQVLIQALLLLDFFCDNMKLKSQ